MPRFASEELAQWSEGVWDPAAPSLIDGVSNDTRTLKPGNLYIALRGARFDGHAFIEQAFASGAGGALVDWKAGVPARCDRPLLRVADTGKALRDIAAAYRLKLAPDVIAVTGSAGKSTVKEMIAQILARVRRTAKTRGNWNNDIGVPLSLLAMESGVQVGVFEVGMNHPGELAPLCDLLKPKAGVVTNVGPVHIEFFASVEAIAREKAAVLECLPADGVAVLNRDGGCFDILRAASPAPVVSVSVSQEADYRCIRRDAARSEVVFEESGSGEQVALRLPLPGLHNAGNALMAVAVSRQFGAGWTPIREALESYGGLPMRWQEIDVAGIRVINDAYNANPLSMAVTLQTFGEQAMPGRKWLVLAGMLELGTHAETEHRRLGALVARGDWAGLITVGPLGDRVADGAAEAGMAEARIFRCGDTREAARAVLGKAVFLKASRGIGLETVVSLMKEGGGGPA